MAGAERGRRRAPPGRAPGGRPRLVLGALAAALALTAGPTAPTVEILAAPFARERWPDVRSGGSPSHVARVAPAIVGLSARADPAAPSSGRLGRRRFGSGVIFDARGYVLTVAYVLMDAVAVEARLRDGRTVPARVVGIDVDTGLAVARLEGAGPWPTAALGQSRDVAEGQPTATVGVDEDDTLVSVTGRIRAIRRFAGSWEYMLERAFLVAPGSPAWGGSAVVDEDGRVIAVASLRLGRPPGVDVAIPTETFLPVRAELIAAGRVVSRPPRPWLGLYTAATPAGVVVEGVAPVGPASTAGFRRGDLVVSVNGVPVGTQEEFYAQLWRGRAGDVVCVGVRRDATVRVIAVRSADRARLLVPRR